MKELPLSTLAAPRHRMPRASALLACALIPLAALHADYTVTPNKSDNRGTWEGWGTSLAWWGNLVGGTSYQSRHAQVLFSYDAVDYLGSGTTIPGLGLNLLRYNIGGGGQPGDVPSTAENVSSTLPWWRDIDGYWTNWTSKDPASSSWNWTRDAEQRAMMIAARDMRTSKNLSALKVEMFSNAPMWWMTPSKSSDGGTLQTWNETDFAHYVANVALYSKNHWGVTPVSVDAFNEPSANWWTYPKNQEGCQILAAQQARVISALDSELTAAGIAGVALAASDENSQSVSRTTYNTLNSTTINSQVVTSLIDRVNVHSYSTTTAADRQNLRAAVGSKKVWVSEYGDSDTTGRKLADQIVGDLYYLKPSAWIYWQAVEPGAWGLVTANFTTSKTDAARAKPTGVNQRYYVFAHFTRWVRDGHTIYGTSDQYTVCAYDPTNKILNFVTVNHGTPQKITYDLSSFSAVTATSAAIRATQMTDGASAYTSSTATVANRSVSIQAAAYSIYTVQVTGVTL